MPKLPDTHKCHNLHGHNYKLVVFAEGEVDERGFVMDFAELDALVLPLIREVDHRLLNEVPGLENPTAELIAAWFLEKVPAACAVQVFETPDYCAEVRR